MAMLFLLFRLILTSLILLVNAIRIIELIVQDRNYYFTELFKL